MFCRSRNVPQSIAIDQESLIRSFGIIKTLKKPAIALNTTKHHKLIFFIRRIFCAIRLWFGPYCKMICDSECDHVTDHKVAQDGVTLLPDLFRIDERHVEHIF